jgi:hypothetical protein
VVYVEKFFIIFYEKLACYIFSFYTRGIEKQNLIDMNQSEEQETMHIAKTILEQIKYADRSALMAWGAKSFAAVSQSKEFQGGLSFRVNGIVHQGWVTVKLRWVDDYTIIFTNKKREVVKTFEGAYCDMLVPVIDWIEGR